jgi:hypothetical protein
LRARRGGKVIEQSRSALDGGHQHWLGAPGGHFRGQLGGQRGGRAGDRLRPRAGRGAVLNRG